MKKIPIIISSMGRSGSTLLFDVLKNYRSNNEFIILHDKLNLKNNFLYKTHSFSEDMPKNCNCKVLYLFSNPYNVVISAHKNTNLKMHYKHMNGFWGMRNQWHIFDSLRLEDNFDSWYKKQNFELLTIKYECLYENINIIEDFIGEKLIFPEIKKRKTNWKNHEFKNDIEKTYGNLFKKINNANNIKIW